MAPSSLKMDHHQAVYTTLTPQLQQQQIDLTSSISDNIIRFVDKFQSDEQLNNQEQHGVSGITPGHYMGRQPVTGAVTNPPFQC